MAPKRDKRPSTRRDHSPWAVNILRGGARDLLRHWHWCGISKHSLTAHYVQRHTRGLHSATPTTRMRARRQVAGRGGWPAATHSSYEGAAMRTAAECERSPLYWSAERWRHAGQPIIQPHIVRDYDRKRRCSRGSRPPYRAFFFSQGVCFCRRM